jgi:hypothetical protein
VVEGGAPAAMRAIGNGMKVRVERFSPPASLTKLHKDAQSIEVILYAPNGTVYLKRYFHGCYMRGRNICFYKPTKKKSGDVWVNHYKDPKTGEIRFYSIYGGKLAGILTQSMCREMFFTSLRKLHAALEFVPNVQIIGQFHDEIVLDWWLDQATHSLTLEQAELLLESKMSDPDTLIGFPLEADVKHDYRYTK